MPLPVIPNTVRNLTRRRIRRRFIADALNDKGSALNDKGSALNDPPCHSEHGEESHSEKDRKRKDNKQIKK